MAAQQHLPLKGRIHMDLKSTVLGIEFGSTRIKAQLLDQAHLPIASGSHEWENRLINGIWTYTLEDIRLGLQDCFADLRKDVREKFGTELTISGMMHGYLPLDRDGEPLTEFRTWRNTCTETAAEVLSDLFHFNIPQRWSIAHLYQAICNQEAHLPHLAHLSTLAGYIHWQLTGLHVMGLGEASGVFPLDYDTLQYDEKMLDDFDALTAKDRPYKPGMPVEKALSILDSMVREGSMDAEILDLFRESKAWEETQ